MSVLVYISLIINYKTHKLKNTMILFFITIAVLIYKPNIFKRSRSLLNSVYKVE